MSTGTDVFSLQYKISVYNSSRYKFILFLTIPYVHSIPIPQKDKMQEEQWQLL